MYGIISMNFSVGAGAALSDMLVMDVTYVAQSVWSQVGYLWGSVMLVGFP